MPRRTMLLPVPAAVVAAVVSAVISLAAPSWPATATPAPPAAEDEAPLALTIDRLSPSSVPKTGKVMVSGWVTNNSDETWEDVAVYTFIAPDPITTSSDLAFETTRSAEQQVGERITVPGTYDDTITELAPGSSLPYTVRVPVSELVVDEAGVYWFGVHALGTNAAGRDTVADGRARTFLPYVPPARRKTPIETALVLPVRHQVLHDRDGRLSDEDSWVDALDDGGQLSSIVDFGLAAGGRPVTWLVDPAVPNAALHVADGNPSRELVENQGGTGVGEGPQDPEEEAPGDDPEASGSAEPTPTDTVESRVATRWLAKLNQAISSKQILALPWGDVDVAAAAKRSTDTYDDARARSGEVLGINQAPMTPAMAAPGGFLDAAALAMADDDTTVLISDGAVTRGTPPSVATYDGQKVVFFSSDVLRGGPGPDDPLASVAMRQRVLSEAAVRMTEPVKQPLVVVFPPAWEPPGGDYSEFFEGLDVDWMSLTTLADATDQVGVPLAEDRFSYPEWQVRHEVDDAAFTTLADLDAEARQLQGVLDVDNNLAARIRSDSLGNVSYFARASSVRSRLSTVATAGWVREALGSITVSGPSKVILSSESGPFSVTITNGLDQPVRVRIRTTSDPPMRINVPEELELAASSTTTRVLEASTDKLGVHTVTIAMTDLEGRPLGSSTTVPFRAAQVSQVIWLVMGGALALLFVAIALRLVRRIRGGGAGSGDAGDGPTADAPAGHTAREPAPAG